MVIEVGQCSKDSGVKTLPHIACCSGSKVPGSAMTVARNVEENKPPVVVLDLFELISDEIIIAARQVCIDSGISDYESGSTKVKKVVNLLIRVRLLRVIQESSKRIKKDIPIVVSVPDHRQYWYCSQ